MREATNAQTAHTGVVHVGRWIVGADDHTRRTVKIYLLGIVEHLTDADTTRNEVVEHLDAVAALPIFPMNDTMMMQAESSQRLCKVVLILKVFAVHVIDVTGARGKDFHE